MIESGMLKGKRIASIDYGKKRIGFAVCDEFHITVSTRDTFLAEGDDLWDRLLLALEKEKIEAVIVGVPYRHDGVETGWIDEINAFIKELEARSGLIVLPFDESFSSRKAVSTMIDIGMKKKKRQIRSNIDKLAAAVILRDFLQEIDG